MDDALEKRARRLEIDERLTLKGMRMTTTRFIPTRSNLSRSLLGVLASLAAGNVGCAAEGLDTRDLGDTPAPLASNDGDGVDSDRTPVVGADGWIDGFIEGHWVGQAEDPFSASGPGGQRPIYVFPSGSTDITLELSLADPASPSGQIVFGSGEVPEPLPAVAYPPGFEAHLALGLTSYSLDMRMPPVEGFAYAIGESVLRSSSGTGVAEGTLAIGFAPNAAYADWCALQVPRPTGDGRFDCITRNETLDPNVNCVIGYADGPDLPYNCNLGALCQARNVCRCNEAQCVAADAGSVDATHLWLIRDGDALLANFVGAVFDYASPGRFMPVGTVRFQRSSP